MTTSKRSRVAAAAARAAAGVLAAGMIATAPVMAADPTDAILRAAAEMTEAYDLPAGLLLAVAETESDFDPSCRTGKCWGLMQIHSSYAAEFARAAGMEDYDLFDPEDSLRIAGWMLGDYITRYEGDLHFALMCYNLGEYGALRRLAGGVETTSYSRKVVSRIEKWAEAGLPDAAADAAANSPAPAPQEENTAPRAPENAGGAATETQAAVIRAYVTGVWQCCKEVLFR